MQFFLLIYSDSSFVFVMPRSKKRKPNPEPESESTSSSSDSDEQESLPQENIQIDLEARSPTESDQSAVVQFLEQSFGNSIKKSVLDLYQLASQLVNQKSCGSVFYQPLDDDDEEEEEEDDESLVLGICSFLQFDQQENKQLKKWFAEKCSENSQAKNILQGKKQKKSYLDELGFEPKTFRMQSEHSTPELHALRRYFVCF